MSTGPLRKMLCLTESRFGSPVTTKLQYRMDLTLLAVNQKYLVLNKTESVISKSVNK